MPGRPPGCGRTAARPVLGRHRRLDLPAAHAGDRVLPPRQLLRPGPFTTYIFGFRNVTGHDRRRSGRDQKNKAQHSAPLFWVNQYDPASRTTSPSSSPTSAWPLRPDLFDAHTLHWHGFRNVIPFFDGEPTGSVSVPSGRDFTYVYRPRDPGTYMYHCHVEDVEHVHMGMTGLVFVRPAAGRQHRRSTRAASTLYNDGDGSTGFDREFAMFLSEVWAEAHWADAHIQLPEWSDYHADFCLLNGRVYPDTLAPEWLDRPVQPGARRQRRPDRTGRPPGAAVPAALVAGDAASRASGWLLRFANLGFREAGDDAGRASR